MAKLVVVEYRPEWKPITLLVVFSVSMFLVLIAGMAGKTEEPLTPKVALLVFIVAVASAGFAVWLWYLGSRLPRVIQELSGLLKIEGDRLVAGRPLQVRRGVLNLVYSTGGRTSYTTYFKEESDETVYLQEVDPMGLPGTGGMMVNVSWKAVNVSSEVEWVKIPGYKVVDPRFRVKGSSVVIGVVKPQRVRITPLKSILEVSRDSERGVAEIRATGEGLEGVVIYTRPPNGRTRGLRLELEFSRKIGVFGAISYRAVIARVKEPGSTRFSWSPSVDEVLYVLMAERFMSPETLAKKHLGIRKPVIMGDAWSGVEEAKIKLVLETPLAPDVVDEARVVIGVE
ncbi:MAG: hypothetical protein GSR85_00920 [Desulfurococcales archaeon]|nr:hypothetical protein [Desulfurococcales archaeon]